MLAQEDPRVYTLLQFHAQNLVQLAAIFCRLNFENVRSSDDKATIKLLLKSLVISTISWFEIVVIFCNILINVFV